MAKTLTTTQAGHNAAALRLQDLSWRAPSTHDKDMSTRLLSEAEPGTGEGRSNHALILIYTCSVVHDQTKSYWLPFLPFMYAREMYCLQRLKTDRSQMWKESRPGNDCWRMPSGNHCMPTRKQQKYRRELQKNPKKLLIICLICLICLLCLENGKYQIWSNMYRINMHEENVEKYV